MKKYLAISQFAFGRALAYKSKIPIMVVEQIMLILANVYIWKAVSEYSDSVAGFNSNQLISYSVVIWLLHRLISNGIDSKIEESYRSGKIVYDFTRPYDLILYHVFDSAGISLFWLIFSVLPTYIVFQVFVGLVSPTGLFHMMSSLICILLSFLILSLMNFIVGMMVFFMEQTKGLRIMKHISMDIFSGLLIPLTFYPLWLQNILDFLPFKYVFFTTIQIWIGSVNTNEANIIMITQLLWVLILGGFAKLCIKICDDHISIQGG